MYCSAGYSHNFGSKAVVSRWLGELGLIVFTNLRKEYYQSCKHFVRNDKQPYHPKSMLRKGTFVSIFLSRSFGVNKWHFPLDRWPMHLTSTRFSIFYARWPALFDTLTPGWGERALGGYLGDHMVFRGNGGVSVVANIVQKGVQYKIDCQFRGRGVWLKYWSAFKLLSFTPLLDKSSQPNEFRHFKCKLHNRNRQKYVPKFVWKPFKSSFS